MTVYSDPRYTVTDITTTTTTTIKGYKGVSISILLRDTYRTWIIAVRDWITSGIVVGRKEQEKNGKIAGDERGGMEQELVIGYTDSSSI